MTPLADSALAGRAIAVTGAARGIGAAIVEAILEAGGSAALLDLDLAATEATARRLDPPGARTLALAADVTSPASVARAAEAAVARFGHLWGWVNNAGIVKMAPAAAIAPDDFDRELAVNARGVLIGAQAAYRAFAGKGGAIVNIASNAGKVGFPNMAAYNASKAAVINLTRSLVARMGGRAHQRQCGLPGQRRHPDAARGRRRACRNRPARTRRPSSPAWCRRNSAATSSRSKSAASSPSCSPTRR